MNRVFFLLLPLILLLGACGASQSVTPTPPEPSDYLELSPTAGFPGTVLTITGANFGTDPDKVTVRFNHEDTARVLSVRPDEIRAIVPQSFYGFEVYVFVNGEQRGGYAPRFRVYNMLDTSYRTVAFDLKGVECGAVWRIGREVESEGSMYVDHATSFKSDLPARYRDGTIQLRSEDVLGGTERVRVLTINPYVGTDSLELELIDTETIRSGDPVKTTGQARRVIHLRNVPYRLSSDGMITCVVTGEALRGVISTAQLVDTRKLTTQTDLYTTDIRSFHPDASLKLVVSTK